MTLNWLQSIIYGFVSGFSQFMPISSSVHEQILRMLFGIERRDVIHDFFVHIASLAALLYGCSAQLDQFKRDNRISQRNRRRTRGTLEIRMIKSAAISLLVVYLILTYSRTVGFSLPMISLFLLINGVIIFVSGRMLQGNKDARSMSKLDSFLIGTAGACSALPGISRVGACTSYAVCRGADRAKALNWALILSVPAMALASCLDLIALFAADGVSAISGNVFGYILSAAFAFAGGYSGVLLIRFLAVKVGFAGYAYYSWGAALFVFVLYLL